MTHTDMDTRKLRRHYLPFQDVQPGMVLGEAVTVAERQVVRFTLPAGHELTEANLHQLGAHHAEFVCVAVPDTRTDEQITADAAAAVASVKHIFHGADLSQPALARLFDRVLAYRSR